MRRRRCERPRDDGAITRIRPGFVRDSSGIRPVSIIYKELTHEQKPIGQQRRKCGGGAQRQAAQHSGFRVQGSGLLVVGSGSEVWVQRSRGWCWPEGGML